MSQKNEIKDRQCHTCYAFIKGTAKDLRKHAGSDECRKAFESLGAYRGQRGANVDTPLIVIP